MATARKLLIDDDKVTFLHAVSRCVRRSFLCGDDSYSGKNFDHRKDWVRDRLEFLTTVFGFEVFSYAALSSHLHIVGRTRPDLVSSWSAEEVARRWGRLFPERDFEGRALPPSEVWISQFVGDEARVKVTRERLRSISWFMRCLNENIARRANREDGCTGRFWEGRFKCQVLADEGAILACMAYVDLNPVRAGIAETPEESEFTSIYERILARTQGGEEASEPTAETPITAETPTTAETATTAETKVVGDEAGQGFPPTSAARTDGPVQAEPETAKAVPPADSQPAGSLESRGAPASWLVPINEIFEVGCSPVLPLDFETYLHLVDTTGRRIRAGKRGAIDADCAPILQRLKLNPDTWVETIETYGKRFRRLAGDPFHLKAAATASGQKWFQGLTSAAETYTPAASKKAA